MLPYLTPLPELLKELATDADKGLASAEAQTRLVKNGPNRLEQSNGKPAWKLFAGQFTNLLVVILAIAGCVSLYLAEYRDAIILFLIVLINAVIGFYQEFKAEKVLEKLKTLVVTKARVLREGRETEVNGEDLVTGDIVKMSEGDKIPADIRLINSESFSTNDFILTGESDPQSKDAKFALNREVDVTDQNNCVFMGTTVARGEAVGVVFATGTNTAIGSVATASNKIAPALSPLQREINNLARRITIVTLVLAVALVVSQLLFDKPLRDAFVFAVGVAASMVPQGLPAQINVALSLGVGRMARKKALLKQLSSVETLGSASVIATDKTGTITKNEMTITHCSFDGRNFTITGTGFAPEGVIYDQDGKALDKSNLGDLKVFFLDGYLSSTGRVNPPDAEHSVWHALGDPTEAAFATLAKKAGYSLVDVDKDYERVKLFPFDSDRKRMSIVRSHKGKLISFAKGGMESILSICTSDIADGTVTELTDMERKHLLELASAYASEGLRVLAVAYKDIANSEQQSANSNPASANLLRQGFRGQEASADKQRTANSSETGKGYEAERTTLTACRLPLAALSLAAVESDMTFAGFVTMADPPHEEVKEAAAAAFAAQVRIIMITGDNAITASAIAEKIGMTLEDGSLPPIIEGEELKTMTDEELSTIFKFQIPNSKFQQNLKFQTANDEEKNTEKTKNNPPDGEQKDSFPIYQIPYTKYDSSPRALIFSRVSPSDKLRIVTVLQNLGHVVAVTGDGVNDVLSLKKADIGVSMGKRGSEVAKEAADMILLDDNFSSIVAAIREGRTIYKNLEKTIVATLNANFGELFCVLLGFIGLFFGLPMAILPVQILAVDLMGELLPLMFLTLDPPESSLMNDRPRRPDKYVMDWPMFLNVALFGLLMGAIAFGSFVMVYLSPVLDAATHHHRAMTAAYEGIMICQFLNILSRRTTRTIFTRYLFSNRALNWSFIISIILILCASYAPPFNYFLYTAPLSPRDWLWPLIGGALFLAVHEGRKMWRGKDSGIRPPLRPEIGMLGD